MAISPDDHVAQVRGRLSDRVAHLYELAAEHLGDSIGAGVSVARATEPIRQVNCWRILRQWTATWESLQLPPSVYETPQFELERELITQPDNGHLRAAHHAWTVAKQHLDEATAQITSRIPTTQEVVDALSWSREQVEQVQNAMQRIVPLEQRVADGDRTVADLIEDSEAPNPSAMMESDRRCRIKARSSSGRP